MELFKQLPVPGIAHLAQQGFCVQAFVAAAATGSGVFPHCVPQPSLATI